MPTPTQQDLPSTLRGDSFSVPVAFTDTNGAPLDLTGWNVIFTLKYNRLQPDADAVLQKRQVVAGSEAVIVVTPGDTNELPPYRYEYDVQVSTPDGTGVRTFLMGYVAIDSGVTHSLT